MARTTGPRVGESWRLEDLLVQVVASWAFPHQAPNPVCLWRPTKSIQLLQLHTGWIISMSFVPQKKNTEAYSQLLSQRLLKLVAWPGAEGNFQHHLQHQRPVQVPPTSKEGSCLCQSRRKAPTPTKGSCRTVHDWQMRQDLGKKL